ncbi:MAG: hypothetical protein M3513_01105 [Actinomycetota bacterium]|nr:hypothetical protein [Actinomycetota bacterium]
MSNPVRSPDIIDHPVTDALFSSTRLLVHTFQEVDDPVEAAACDIPGYRRDGAIEVAVLRLMLSAAAGTRGPTC